MAEGLEDLARAGAGRRRCQGIALAVSIIVPAGRQEKRPAALKTSARPVKRRCSQGIAWQSSSIGGEGLMK